MRISDWSSDVCSSDLHAAAAGRWSLVAVLDPDYPLPSTVAADDGDTPLPDRAPLALLRDALREGRFDGHERLLSLLSPRELGGLLLDDDAPPSLPRIASLLDRGADPGVRAAARDPDRQRVAYEQRVLDRGELAGHRIYKKNK